MTFLLKKKLEVKGEYRIAENFCVVQIFSYRQKITWISHENVTGPGQLIRSDTKKKITFLLEPFSRTFAPANVSHYTVVCVHQSQIV